MTNEVTKTAPAPTGGEFEVNVRAACEHMVESRKWVRGEGRDGASRYRSMGEAYWVTEVSLIEFADALRCAPQSTPTATPPTHGLPYGIIDPDYARVYTIARVLAWSEGYALAMHGSFARDLDLLAVPWADHACDPEHLVRRIEGATGLKLTRHPPGEKPHGRRAWTLLFPTFGDPRFVDISVMPKQPLPAAKEGNEK